MNRYEQFRGWVGSKVNGITLAIDLINSCGLECPTCSFGNLGGRPGGKMSIETFRKVLDRAEEQFKIRRIQFFQFSDPLLVPNLHEYIAEAGSRGYHTQISSALQTIRCDMARVIEARPSEFRIAYSGKEMHKYQVGGKSDVFLKNLEAISGLPRYSETKWVMFFLKFRGNEKEEESIRKLAQKHRFTLVSYPAIFGVVEKLVEGNFTQKDRSTLEMLIESPADALARIKARKYCPVQTKQFNIDARGKVYLCVGTSLERFVIGDWFKDPAKELRSRMVKSDFCKRCMSLNVHAYCQCFDNDETKEDRVDVRAKSYRDSGDMLDREMWRFLDIP